MKPFALVILVVASVVFIGATGAAKMWALAPSSGKLVLTLSLYTIGNLLMLLLIRDVGMATAFSLTGVVQLIAVNLVAILVFGERLGLVQSIGMGFAVVAVALITLGPHVAS